MRDEAAEHIECEVTVLSAGRLMTGKESRNAREDRERQKEREREEKGTKDWSGGGKELESFKRIQVPPWLQFVLYMYTRALEHSRGNMTVATLLLHTHARTLYPVSSYNNTPGKLLNIRIRCILLNCWQSRYRVRGYSLPWPVACAEIWYEGVMSYIKMYYFIFLFFIIKQKQKKIQLRRKFILLAFTLNYSSIICSVRTNV
jgi:hypothetical protein